MVRTYNEGSYLEFSVLVGKAKPGHLAEVFIETLFIPVRAHKHYLKFGAILAVLLEIFVPLGKLWGESPAEEIVTKGWGLRY